jgi:AraC-like DNA-binding protein
MKARCGLVIGFPCAFLSGQTQMGVPDCQVKSGPSDRPERGHKYGLVQRARPVAAAKNAAPIRQDIRRGYDLREGDPAMTPNPFAAAAFRRLRPDSDRAVRLMRLAVLIGWSVAEMAAQFALSRSTIKRRLKHHDLRAPETPGERDRLMTEELNCSLAEALLRGEDSAAKDYAALLQKLNPGSRPKAAPAETTKEENDPYTDEGHDAFMAKLESLAALEFELAAGDLDGNPPEGWEQPGRLETKSDAAPSVPAGRPAYAASAAGPDADVVAFGRTWRRQDTGGRRMGALGGADGGLWQGGAGGADLLGCARSDDRGAERPDLVGDPQGRPAGLAAFAPPA